MTQAAALEMLRPYIGKVPPVTEAVFLKRDFPVMTARCNAEGNFLVAYLGESWRDLQGVTYDTKTDTVVNTL